MENFTRKKLLGNKKRRDPYCTFSSATDKSSKYLSQRSVMNHLRGIPPSPNWSNKYSTLIMGNNLLYISNLYIVNIDLGKREFSQLIYWAGIEKKEKLNVICKLNEEKFLSVTNEGNFIIFIKYFNKNTEDKRAYFKESGQSFKFNSISHETQIKTIQFSKSKDILICCDNKGSLYMIKLLNLENQNIKLEMKFISSINLCKENIFITDLSLLSDTKENCDFVIICDSLGTLSSYSFSNNDNFVKINQIGVENKIESKHIFSIDCVYVDSIGSYLLSVLDKNGSLSLYVIKFEKAHQNIVSNWKLIFFDKNKFNDKFYEEKYLYFSTRILLDAINESFTIIITSNRGKIFTLNLSFGDLDAVNSDKFKNFKEISENPHSMAIFSSEIYKDKILFISADRLITVFKFPEFIFEYDIKTQGTRSNFLLKEKTRFKNLYAFNQDEVLYQYNYSKIINGLGIVARNPLKHKLGKKKSKEPQTKKLKIFLAKQSEFNEFIFALVQEDIDTKKISIAIYDFLSDIMIAKKTIESSVSSLIFHHSRIFNNEEYNRTVKSEGIARENTGDRPEMGKLSEKKYEKISSAIEQLFSNETNYNLLYVLDSNGMITLWDYILNKVNCFNLISYSKPIAYSMLVPLETDQEYLMAVLLNSRNEISIYVLNQIIAFELHNFKLYSNLDLDHKQNAHIETECESNVPSVTDNLVCDYFSSNTCIELIFVENSKDLKIFHFTKEFFEFCKFDITISYTKFNEAINKYGESLISKKEFTSNEGTKIKNNFFIEINFKKVTQGEIKNLKINKNSLTARDDPSRLIMNIAISQIDGMIKIYDVIIEETNSRTFTTSLILNFSINSHIAKIIEICWLDDALLATSSVDNSVKLWNVKMCKLIDVKLAENIIESSSTELETKNTTNTDAAMSFDNLKLVNNFNKVNSICFYQQSFKFSNEFGNYFDEFYKKYLENHNIIEINKIPEEYLTDFLLFFHFDPNVIGLNFDLAVKLIRVELKCCLELGNITKYLTNLINLFLYAKYFNLTSILEEFLEKLKNKLLNSPDNGNIQIKDNKNELISINITIILDILDNFQNFEYLERFSSYLPIDYFKMLSLIINDHTLQDKIYPLIKELVKNNNHIDAIVLYKLFKIYDINLYLSIIDKLSSFIYSKHIFQSQKCKKVIEILRNYFKI